jgi:hypothetical protein
MHNPFDRKAENLGNITGLEHVNVEIPDQGLASNFYLVGCGFTRDPYLFPGTNNMWVNIGKTQFHLPTGDPLVFRGSIGIVSPDREALLERLHGVRKALKGTRFKFRETNDYVEATCPWGNRLRLHSPDVERFGSINLGIAYVEFDVPPGTADKIARFYREIFDTSAAVENGAGRTARVSVGEKQELRFKETDKKLPEYDGHHLQVYVSDFDAPHKKLQKLDLITEESDRCQYRWEEIVDLDSGKVVYQIEHEIRSMTHPLFLRHLNLVNRNPAQSNRSYQTGGDQWVWALPDGVGMANMVKDPLKAPKAPTIARRRALRLQQQAM